MVVLCGSALSCQVDPDPKVDFKYCRDPINPSTVIFRITDKVSYGGVLTYGWNFGDGTECDAQCRASATIRHSYDKNATYAVTLVATDENLATSMPRTHLVLAGNHRPVPVLEVPDLVFVNHRVLLDGSRSRDPDGNIRRWEFEFVPGDLKPVVSFDPIAPVVFPRTMTYTVKLTVYDDDGEPSDAQVQMRSQPALDLSCEVTYPGERNVTVLETDARPPTVAIVSPNDGDTVRGTIRVRAVAQGELPIDEVQFYVGGNELIGTDRDFPFEMPWDTIKVFNGTYELSARAFDVRGAFGSSAVVRVFVRNQ